MFLGFRWMVIWLLVLEEVKRGEKRKVGIES